MTTDNLRKGGGRGEGRKREKEGKINKETEIRKSGTHIVLTLISFHGGCHCGLMETGALRGTS